MRSVTLHVPSVPCQDFGHHLKRMQEGRASKLGCKSTTAERRLQA